MAELESLQPIADRPAGPSKVRVFRVAAAITLFIVISAGVSLWSASRPRYHVLTSDRVGAEHAVLVVEYPADWTVAPMNTDELPLQRDVAWVNLQRAPSNGLQKWIDAILYRITDRDWRYSRFRKIV